MASGRAVDVRTASLADGVGTAVEVETQQQHAVIIDTRTVMIFAVRPDFQKLAMCFMMFSLQPTGKNLTMHLYVLYAHTNRHL